MRDLDELFAALDRSAFRRGKRLGAKEAEYLRSQGIETVERHAFDLIRKRLAPALPVNDGKQTPWQGHPVFVAQHATATCCRSCLEKWHKIEKGRALTDKEVDYVVRVIRRWLEANSGRERY
jgi:hypothetical protein